jgi:hypothetical protein
VASNERDPEPMFTPWQVQNELPSNRLLALRVLNSICGELTPSSRPSQAQLSKMSLLLAQPAVAVAVAFCAVRGDSVIWVYMWGTG